MSVRVERRGSGRWFPSYAPRIAGAQTPAEMRRLLNLMVGELNASHMGVAAGGRGGGAGGDGPSVGRLGLRFDRTEYEQAGRLRITEIVDEYEKTILDELDLQREAANAAQLRRNFAGMGDLLYVPEVYWDWCRVDVMAMERIRFSIQSSE